METFDWIQARSACSLGVVFEHLKNQVGEDVKSRQKLRKVGAEYGFTFSDHSSTSFSVLVQGNNLHSAVNFNLLETGIRVNGNRFEGAPDFEVKVTLNEDGECRAKINGNIYEF